MAYPDIQQEKNIKKKTMCENQTKKEQIQNGTTYRYSFLKTWYFSCVPQIYEF